MSSQVEPTVVIAQPSEVETNEDLALDDFIGCYNPALLPLSNVKKFTSNNAVLGDAGWRANVSSLQLEPANDGGEFVFQLTKIQFYDNYQPTLYTGSGSSWDISSHLIGSTGTPPFGGGAQPLPSSSSSSSSSSSDTQPPRRFVPSPYAALATSSAKSSTSGGANNAASLTNKFVTTALLFGCDRHGNSIALHVPFPTYFHLRFFIDTCDDAETPHQGTSGDIYKTICKALDSYSLTSQQQQQQQHTSNPGPRPNVNVVSYRRMLLKHLYGFVPSSIDKPTEAKRYPVWRVHLSSASMISNLIMHLRSEHKLTAYVVDDTTIVDNQMRWIQETNISPSHWVAVKASKLREVSSRCMMTTCQVELAVSNQSSSSTTAAAPAAIRPLSGSDGYDLVAPLTVFTFLARSNTLIPPNRNSGSADCVMDPSTPVTSIGISLSTYGSPNPHHTYIITTARSPLKPVYSPLESTTVIDVSSEAECLTVWRDLLVSSSPDLLHGPSSFTRQWQWMFSRFEACGLVGNSSPLFMNFSRIVNTNGSPLLNKLVSLSPPKRIKTKIQYSSLIDLHGICEFDLCFHEMVNPSKSQSEFNLSNVCAKHGVTIVDNAGCDDTTAAAAASSAEDHLQASLKATLDATIASGAIELQFALARSCWMTVDGMDKIGQQRAYYNQICVEAFRHGHFIESSDFRMAPLDGGYATYDGAHVFDPQPGMWTCPVMELDFSSFFVRILMSFNFCISTLIVPFAVVATGDGKKMQKVIKVIEKEQLSSSHALESSPDFTNQIIENGLVELFGPVDEGDVIVESRKRAGIFQSSACTWKIPYRGTSSFCHFLTATTTFALSSDMDGNNRMSLTSRILEDAIKGREAAKQAMAKLINDPTLYDAASKEWICADAKKRYTCLKCAELAQKLRGNAVYGNPATKGALRCMAVSAVVAYQSRMLILNAASTLPTWNGSTTLVTSEFDPLKMNALKAIVERNRTKCAATTKNFYRNACVAATAKRFGQLVDEMSTVVIKGGPPNPFGITIVAGDSDSIFAAITCLLPDGESDLSLSTSTMALAFDVAHHAAEWISSYNFGFKLGLPQIQMKMEQVMSPFLAPTIKKRYAALQWSRAAVATTNSPNNGGGTISPSLAPKLVTKSLFIGKVSVPLIVQEVITATLYQLLTTLNSDGVPQRVFASAIAPRLKAITAAVNGPGDPSLVASSLMDALQSFTKYEMIDLSPQLQTSPARKAAIQMASYDKRREFISGEHVGVIKLKPSAGIYSSSLFGDETGGHRFKTSDAVISLRQLAIQIEERRQFKLIDCKPNNNIGIPNAQRLATLEQHQSPHRHVKDVIICSPTTGAPQWHLVIDLHHYMETCFDHVNAFTSLVSSATLVPLRTHAANFSASAFSLTGYSDQCSASHMGNDPSSSAEATAAAATSSSSSSSTPSSTLIIPSRVTALKIADAKRTTATVAAPKKTGGDDRRMPVPAFVWAKKRK